MALEFDVVIIEDETGGYVASVPSLPGCRTQAETLDELMKNVQEAIQLYLETLEEDEKRDLLKQKVSGIQRVSIPG
ncbi:MAG: type II toxin-antitoxin system HicB family antitoxin [Thermoproteota archaeon]|nr:type II toxin-antitoxin system HicB family antitoxin [Candidatus Brockarchaeota archaeon]